MTRKGFFASIAAGIAAMATAPARLVYERRDSAFHKDVPIKVSTTKLTMAGGMARWGASMEVADAEAGMWRAGATAVSATYRYATWSEKARGIVGVYEIRGTCHGPKPPWIREGVQLD